MSSNSDSSDARPPANFGEIPSDPLGDTQLGRGLRDLIKEIGREKEALRYGLVADEGVGTESQDGDAFDSGQSRFDQVLELAAPTQEQPAAPGNGAQRPAGGQEAGSDTGNPGGVAQTEIARAMSEIEQVLQRFAEAERRRSEDLIAESKVQFKKATMIVVKKQLDTARAKWMQNLSAHESAIAEHYRRLKVLADKVAKQKAQIQLAKKELEDKLRVADQLHTEFDEIRDVLDGQIDAIDALDKSDDPTEL
ncbi:MAG: hypothetical protein QNL90_09945 [Gammaproteobacteria bacterium]|nr:hypothetical protein [Gammaproteobacteria bacterium]